MTTYRVLLPNDYGSEQDAKALSRQFPELEGRDLEVAAFGEIHILWPGLKIVRELDFGGEFQSETPPPENLPVWAWVTAIDPE